MNKSKGFIQAVAIVPLLGLIVMAFVVGILWQKVQSLEKGGTTSTTATTTQQTGTAAPATQITLSQIKDLYNKDLIKFGDANRKVLFTEIADPSCPYCHIAGGLNSELNNQQPQFKLVKDGGTYIAPVPE